MQKKISYQYVDECYDQIYLHLRVRDPKEEKDSLSPHTEEHTMKQSCIA